jgi:4'-phosphopantetheinyl transferase
MKECGRSVQIKLASIAALSAEIPDVGSWLSESERQRLCLITSTQRARQFLAGHWLLRTLAADALGGDARDWSMLACSDHAPVLSLSPHDEGRDVHGSLSHCGDLVAAAIASFPVGIDVERPSKPRSLLAIAEATFSPRECAELQGLPESERPAAFYLYWTMKEAAGKREGHGLRPELARRQQPQECAANEAELISWQIGECSLALAGKPGMSIRASGLPGPVSARYWRIGSTAA